MLNRNARPKAEILGESYFYEVVKLLKVCQGRFGMEGKDKYFMDFGDGGKCYLNYKHDNLELAGILLETCDTSTHSAASKVCIQRLLIEAREMVLVQQEKEDAIRERQEEQQESPPIIEGAIWNKAKEGA